MVGIPTRIPTSNFGGVSSGTSREVLVEILKGVIEAMSGGIPKKSLQESRISKKNFQELRFLQRFFQ